MSYELQLVKNQDALKCDSKTPSKVKRNKHYTELVLMRMFFLFLKSSNDKYPEL